jgi:hypothetical protein
LGAPPLLNPDFEDFSIRTTAFVNFYEGAEGVEDNCKGHSNSGSHQTTLAVVIFSFGADEFAPNQSRLFCESAVKTILGASTPRLAGCFDRAICQNGLKPKPTY